MDEEHLRSHSKRSAVGIDITHFYVRSLVAHHSITLTSSPSNTDTMSTEDSTTTYRLHRKMFHLLTAYVRRKVSITPDSEYVFQLAPYHLGIRKVR